MNRTRRSRLTAALVAGLALAACTSDDGTGTAAATQPEGAEVELVRLRFEPEVLTVPAGTEVTWQWTEQLAHNVTGDDFASDTKPDGTFSHTFDDTGDFDYTCTLHPGMEGTIVVE